MQSNKMNEMVICFLFYLLLIGLYGCIISSMLPNMETNILLCGILFHSLIYIYHTYYLVPDNIQLLTDLTIYRDVCKI